MNQRKRFMLRAAFGLALVASTRRTLAQFGRPGGMGPGGRGPDNVGDCQRGGTRPGDRREMGTTPEPTPVLEITLHEFEEDLKLRPEQRPLFNAYAGRIRALASDVERERRRPQAARQVGVLQRIDRSVDSTRNRLTAVEEIAVAAKALFVALAPDQQEAANPRLATLMLLPLDSTTPDGPMKPPGGPGRSSEAGWPR